MFRIAILRVAKSLGIRHGSSAARPLPPPSPLRNIPEYIEPGLMAREHVAPTYRSSYTPSKLSFNVGTFAGVVAWTWILLGLYYQPEEVLGHHPWPDASEWTNKELGIPDSLPDDA